MQHKLQTQHNQDVKDVETTVKELLHNAKDSSVEGELLVFFLMIMITICMIKLYSCSEKNRAQIKATALLTDFTVAHGDETMLAWRKMIPQIWTTYRDGYVFSGLDQSTVSVQRMFYPEWWLQQVGYFNPMNLNHDKDAILFSSNPSEGSGVGSSTSILPVMGALVVGLLLGMYVARREGARDGYSTIPSAMDRANAL